MCVANSSFYHTKQPSLQQNYKPHFVMIIIIMKKNRKYIG